MTEWETSQPAPRLREQPSDDPEYEALSVYDFTYEVIKTPILWDVTISHDDSIVFKVQDGSFKCEMYFTPDQIRAMFKELEENAGWYTRQGGPQ